MAKMHPAPFRQEFHWKRSWPYLRPLVIGGGHRDKGWWWTPWTYRFGHGGWVYLSARWFWKFRNGVSTAHMQDVARARAKSGE